MNEEEARVYLKNYIKVKKEVIKERQKEGLNADSRYTQQLEEMVEAFETVLNLLEKKDQQIDLLSEILRYYNGMQQEQCFCIDICGEKECNMKNCKERIKQYVEYKVEEKVVYE